MEDYLTEEHSSTEDEESRSMSNESSPELSCPIKINLQVEKEMSNASKPTFMGIPVWTRAKENVKEKKMELVNNVNHFIDRLPPVLSQRNSSITEEVEDDLCLSDSHGQASLQEKLSDKLDDKKQKKKNRISQMISGVGQRSKAELFQKIFKDLSEDEQLIADYSCALRRDILVHGRLYLSQTWLCFYANIFGWETLVTLQWQEISAITKEKTAKVIPNAIQIFTGTDKYFFTTFVTRERAYTALFRIWQNALLGQPICPSELKVICKKYRQKKGTNFAEVQDGDPVNDAHDETGDEVVEDEDSKSLMSSESIGESGKTESVLETSSGHNKDVVSSVSDFGPIPLHHNDEVQTDRSPSSISMETKSLKNKSTPLSTWNKAHDFLSFTKKKRKQRPKIQSYLPVPDFETGETTTDFNDEETDSEVDKEKEKYVLCPCHDNHCGKEYTNEEFDFDVDALFEHLFSQESDIMKRVFEQRSFENWKYTPLTEMDGCKTQTLSYTIPLNYSIGPKHSDTSSKQVFSKDNTPGSYYVINVENISYGIPYADSFSVKTKYCLTRASGNRSVLKAHGELVYTKKVFGLVKNMISRGADDALKEYFAFLVQMLKSDSRISPKKASSKTAKKRVTRTKSKETTQIAASFDKPSRRRSSNIQSLTTSPSKDINFLSSLRSSSTIFTAFTIILLLLFSMNLYLFVRLRSLESSMEFNQPVFRESELPSSPEEWKNLLHYQKNLHNLELKKLREFVATTSSLMKQAEKSISAIYKELSVSYPHQLESKPGEL